MQSEPALVISATDLRRLYGGKQWWAAGEIAEMAHTTASNVAYFAKSRCLEHLRVNIGGKRFYSVEFVEMYLRRVSTKAQSDSRVSNDKANALRRQILAFMGRHGMAAQGLSVMAGLSPGAVGSWLRRECKPCASSCKRVRKAMRDYAKSIERPVAAALPDDEMVRLLELQQPEPEPEPAVTVKSWWQRAWAHITGGRRCT